MKLEGYKKFFKRCFVYLRIGAHRHYIAKSADKDAYSFFFSFLYKFHTFSPEQFLKRIKYMMCAFKSRNLADFSHIGLSQSFFFGYSSNFVFCIFFSCFHNKKFWKYYYENYNFFSFYTETFNYNKLTANCEHT